MSTNVENIRKWVEALRSGDYMQGAGRLRTGDCYCCLGVACDISGLGLWEDRGVYVVNGRSAALGLPAEIQDWLGLDDAIPRVGDFLLSDLNDRGGKSFPEIADLVEAAWLAGATS